MAETVTSGRRAARGAAVFGLVTMGSRVLGYARDALGAALFGASAELGAFNLAWLLPNLLRKLFGEGAISAAVLPALARSEAEEGRESALRLFARAQGLLFLVLLSVVLLGELVLTAWLAAAPSTDTEQVLRLARILLPYALPICMTAMAAGAQNLGGRFFWPAVAPAVLNGVWIGVLLALTGVGVEGRETVALGWLSAGLLVGGFLQWLLQQAPLRSQGWPLLPRLSFRDERLRVAARAFLPALLGLAAVQINLALDQVLARMLVGPEANNFTYLANRLLQVPLASVAIAGATGAFPRLAQLASRRESAAFSRTLVRAMEMTLLVLFPAGLGLALLAGPTALLLFEHGQFTAADSALLVKTLWAYLPSLLFAGPLALLVRAHYSHEDRLRPALLAAALVPLNIVLNIILLPRLGVPGAGWATSISLGVQTLLLWRSLRKHGVYLAIPAPRLARLLAPGAFMAVALSAFARIATEPFWNSFIGWAVGIVGGIAVVAITTATVLPDEFREMRSLFSRANRSRG